MTRPVRADIDLGAVRHNLGRAREQVARVMAVVKADAYGHGAVPVAKALQDAADGFAVASVDEALVLRRGGIRGPVTVLGGAFDGDDVVAAAEHALSLVVHDAHQLDLLQGLPDNAVLPVWLKIDTGMHRLGVAPDAVPAIWQALQGLPGVGTVGLMTHFACSDEPEHAQNAAQQACFDAIAAQPDHAGAPLSLSNSGGVVHGPDTREQTARPGIMLYGASPLLARSAAALDLRPAMTLSTRVVALRDLAAGEPIGYGGAFVAQQPMRMAVAAIGYGDGYPRHAPSGTPVLVDGQRAMLAGRVSMDLVTIDVSGLDGVAVGSRVELWGSSLPADEVATAAGTIAYELFTSVTARVPRHHDGA